MAVLINMYVWGNGEGLVRKGRGGAMGKGKGEGLGLGRVWIIVDRTKTAKSNVETGNHCSYMLILFLCKVFKRRSTHLSKAPKCRRRLDRSYKLPPMS